MFIVWTFFQLLQKLGMVSVTGRYLGRVQTVMFVLGCHGSIAHQSGWGQESHRVHETSMHGFQTAGQLLHWHNVSHALTPH